MADCMKNASEAAEPAAGEGLGRLVAEGKIPAEPIPAFRVEVPADKSHGDFAANDGNVRRQDIPDGTSENRRTAAGCSFPGRHDL